MSAPSWFARHDIISCQTVEQREALIVTWSGMAGVAALLAAQGQTGCARHLAKRCRTLIAAFSTPRRLT